MSNTLTSEQRIMDDSHAKAVLRHQIHLAEQHYDRIATSALSHLPKSRKKLFALIIKTLSNALKPTVIYESLGPDLAGSKRQVYTVSSMARLLRNAERRIDPASGDLLACTTIKIDPKKLHQMNCEEYCYVSEHALQRVVRRSQCRSMQEIIQLVGKYLIWIDRNRDVVMAHGDSRHVLVGPDGYMPLCYANDLGKPLILTWVPRGMWRPEQEAKLTGLARYCETSGEMRLIDADVFAGRSYFDPLDSSGYIN